MSLGHLVEKLAAFEPQGDLPVVSLYLNAQADDHGRHNFHTFVRKQFPEFPPEIYESITEYHEEKAEAQG